MHSFFEDLKEAFANNKAFSTFLVVASAIILLIVIIEIYRAIRDYLKERRIRKLLTPDKKEERLAIELISKTGNTEDFYKCFFKEFVDEFDEYDSTIVRCYPVFGAALIKELRLMMVSEFIDKVENDLRTKIDEKQRGKALDVQIKDTLQNTDIANTKYSDQIKEEKEKEESKIASKDIEDRHIMNIVPSVIPGGGLKSLKTKIEEDEQTRPLSINISKVVISLDQNEDKDKSEKISSNVALEKNTDPVSVTEPKKDELEGEEKKDEAVVVNKDKKKEENNESNNETDQKSEKKETKKDVSEKDVENKNEELQENNVDNRSVKTEEKTKETEKIDEENLEKNNITEIEGQNRLVEIAGTNNIDPVSIDKMETEELYKNEQEKENLENSSKCEVLKPKNFFLIKYLLETNLSADIYFYKIIKIFLIKLLLNLEFDYNLYDSLVTEFPKIRKYRRDLLTNLFIVRDFEKRMCQLEYGDITKRAFRKK